MTMDWHDYTGARVPQETTWFQLKSGEVITAEAFNSGACLSDDVLRYYGPAPVAAEPDPILPIPREDWEEMAQECVTAIFNGENVYVLHPTGYERCGLGIPAKRGENNCHEYRPIVVLEWIADMVKAAK